ncbi:HPP family protein [Salinithrix halophila]|uniref:HPP family protein n=1 Tax=Salinithrix halophila TaxID=1485204 RepID=A0ABV8JBD5_9BACL
MTPREELVTVTPDCTITEVIRRMKLHALDSVPVVDQHDRFLGLTGYGRILKSLLRQENPSSISLLQQVADAVEKMEPVSVDGDFEEVLPVIVRYPFVPITDEDGIFLGIAKISNIESALSLAFGTGLRGTRLLIGVFMDQPRLLERILASLKSYNVNIISLATFDAGDTAARRILLKLSPSSHTRDIVKNLNEQGFRVLSVKEA